MPELTIKYKNAKVKEALTDFSKYLDFEIVAEKPKRKSSLYKQIENGLKDVKKITTKQSKGLSIKEMLNEK